MIIMSWNFYLFVSYNVSNRCECQSCIVKICVKRTAIFKCSLQNPHLWCSEEDSAAKNRYFTFTVFFIQKAIDWGDGDCSLDWNSSVAEQRLSLVYSIHQQGQRILFSVVFTPPPPLPPRTCLAPTCHLSTLNSLYRRSGLAYPYDWRDFVGAKKKACVGLLVMCLFLSSIHYILVYKSCCPGNGCA
jgi:hypothetical protein